MTDRQKKVLAELDAPTPCTVVIGGTIGRDCEQAAVWEMRCRGCGQRALTCPEHHALVLSITAAECPQCRKSGPLALVFVFERLAVVGQR